MALKFGLNVKKKSAAAATKPKATLAEDDDGPPVAIHNEAPVEEISLFSASTTAQEQDRSPPKPRNAAKLPSRVPKKLEKLSDDQTGDLSSLAASREKVKKATDLDASIFDYDSFHDAKSTVDAAKQAAATQDAIERKPKYINNLLDAAARRKQDQLIAREKLLQREREAEGDEFADKEKFVTGAYKQQQAEALRLEAEEKKKAEEEDRRKRELGGGMQGFYKNMMDQTDQKHQEALQVAALLEKNGGVRAQSEQASKEKTGAEMAAELKSRGVNVHVNEEGEITDKRQLLSAGLNIAPSGKGSDSHGADHLKTSARPAQNAFQRRNPNDQQAMRERQTRMLEEQLEATAKRAREEEEEERARLEHAAKSQKSESDVSDAKARYLARKAAKEGK